MNFSTLPLANKIQQEVRVSQFFNTFAFDKKSNLILLATTTTTPPTTTVIDTELEQQEDRVSQ